MRQAHSCKRRAGHGAMVGTVLLLSTACGGKEGDGSQGADVLSSPSSGTAWTTEETFGNGHGTAKDPVVLKEVTVEQGDGFDRVAVEYQGDVPDYIATYMDPLAYEGPGTEVEMAGDQHPQLVGMPQESAFTATEATALVPEVRSLGVFEKELGIGIGVASPAGEPFPYRVGEEERDVVDITRDDR